MTFLTASERELVIGTVVDEVGGAVPVLAGIVESSATRAVEAGQVATQAGADYLVATGPFYGELAESAIVSHFERIADKLKLPIIAYDIPVKTHKKSSVDIIHDLAHRRVVVGPKDSSGDFWAFRAITCQSRQSSFTLLAGSDPMVDAALLMEASGAVVGVASIAASSFVDLYRSATAGDWEAACAQQERIARVAAIPSLGLV